MLFVLLKKVYPFLSIYLLTLFLFTACQPEPITEFVEETPVEPEIRSFPGVDERLWIYFDRFEQEGQARGLDIDLVATQITGVINDLEGEHVAGQCTTYGGARPNRVTLDTDFWEGSSDLFKEFIIFHELGHCFLNRDHREDAFSNGRCVSLMRSGTLSCRDNYNVTTRASYIDELFEPTQIDL